MRKIELDTPEELRFLIANVSAVARQKMDAQLKPDDALRPRVEELVREYVMKTFSLAMPSVSVNAMDAGDVEGYVEGEFEGIVPSPRDSGIQVDCEGFGNVLLTLRFVRVRTIRPPPP